MLLAICRSCWGPYRPTFWTSLSDCTLWRWRDVSLFWNWTGWRTSVQTSLRKKTLRNSRTNSAPSRDRYKNIENILFSALCNINWIISYYEVHWINRYLSLNYDVRVWHQTITITNSYFNLANKLWCKLSEKFIFIRDKYIVIDTELFVVNNHLSCNVWYCFFNIFCKYGICYKNHGISFFYIAFHI